MICICSGKINFLGRSTSLSQKMCSWRCSFCCSVRADVLGPCITICETHDGSRKLPANAMSAMYILFQQHDLLIQSYQFYGRIPVKFNPVTSSEQFWTSTLWLLNVAMLWWFRPSKNRSFPATKTLRMSPCPEDQSPGRMGRSWKPLRWFGF